MKRNEAAARLAFPEALSLIIAALAVTITFALTQLAFNHAEDVHARHVVRATDDLMRDRQRAPHGAPTLSDARPHRSP